MQSQPAENAAQLWLLVGQKAGDNSQLRLLEESVGLPSTDIPMRYSRLELLTTLTSRPSLMGLARESRAAIAPPWPRLVLTAGRRNEAAARWIRAQSRGQSKLVHIGRPWHHPRHFDLVITSPQYKIEPGPKILCLDLPLHASAAPQDSAEQFDHLPQPHIVLLIGGNSGSVTLHAKLADRLLAQSSKLALGLGGSLLISTSARTPENVAKRLRELSVPHQAWCWGEPDNPYQAYLGAADAFIVTSDSVSMLAEALSTSKPVFIFDLEERRWWLRPAHYRPNALLHRLAMRIAPKRLRRDVGRIHRNLVDSGRIQWLERDTNALPDSHAAHGGDLFRATQAVRALLAG